MRERAPNHCFVLLHHQRRHFQTSTYEFYRVKNEHETSKWNTELKRMFECEWLLYWSMAVKSGVEMRIRVNECEGQERRSANRDFSLLVIRLRFAHPLAQHSVAYRATRVPFLHHTNNAHSFNSLHTAHGGDTYPMAITFWGAFRKQQKNGIFRSD